MADPTALTVAAFAAAFDAVVRPKASGVVLAVSGGPDSMALMHLVARARAKRPGLRVTVGTVDHCLRPGSAADGALVEAEALALGLSCRRLLWQGAKPARAVQEKARDARYALLGALCADVGADHLVTAHTEDDQAETLLFRLLRGSGVTGLGGMRSVTERATVTLARPLLGVSKACLIATCNALAVPFRTDPANADPRFARARLRRILPTLAREGFDAPGLAKLARRMARADAALEAAAAAAFADCRVETGSSGCCIDGARAVALQPELLIRVLSLGIEHVGGSAARLDRLEALAARLTASAANHEALHATLGGTVVVLTPGGVLSIVPEGPRRRGLADREAKVQSVARCARDTTGRAGVEGFPWQA